MAQPSAACVRRSGAAAYANRKIHERKGNASQTYDPPSLRDSTSGLEVKRQITLPA